MMERPKKDSDLVSIKVPISHIPKVYGFIDNKDNSFTFFCSKCQEFHRHGAVKGSGGNKASYGHRCCHCEDKKNYLFGYLLYDYNSVKNVKKYLWI